MTKTEGKMRKLQRLQRFSVGVLIATHRTGLFDFQMNHIDMPFENDQMFECFSTVGALVWPLSHMID